MWNDTNIPRDSMEHSPDDHTPLKDFERFLQENENLIRAILKPYYCMDEYDDLMQEACIGIFKAFSTYNPGCGSKFTSYAFTCAKNEILMYLRKKNTKSRAAKIVSLETWDGNEDNQNRLLDHILGSNSSIAAQQSLEDQLYMHMAFQSAMKIIRTEMDQMEQIIVMQFWAGRPQKEIAEELGISQSSVSKSLSRILKKLHNRMIDLGFIDAV